MKRPEIFPEILKEAAPMAFLANSLLAVLSVLLLVLAIGKVWS